MPCIPGVGPLFVSLTPMSYSSSVMEESRAMTSSVDSSKIQSCKKVGKVNPVKKLLRVMYQNMLQNAL